MDDSKIAVQVQPMKQALLFELEESLAAPLSAALEQCEWKAVRAQHAQRPAQAKIVFCAPDREVLVRAFRSYKNLPVVVVSRLPEIEGWLDALEAGAADYCAAPFEASQLRWLLDTHSKKPRLAA
jgi:DNA-binding response OmpR family regulator